MLFSLFYLSTNLYNFRDEVRIETLRVSFIYCTIDSVSGNRWERVSEIMDCR